MPDILALISAHTETPRTVEPGTLLADIGLNCASILVGLQCDIEEALGRELPSLPGGGDAYEAWETVADVLASAERTES